MQKVTKAEKNAFTDRRSISPTSYPAPSALKSNLSPSKMTQQDILNQVNIVDKENLILKMQIEERKQELESLNFKHAKAQSRFIEVMRDLSKLRDEFNDSYSIKSKMIKVKEVTNHIEELLNIKDYRLVHEEETLRKFQQ